MAAEFITYVDKSDKNKKLDMYNPFGDILSVLFF
jgi:hypothetical protein